MTHEAIVAEIMRRSWSFGVAVLLQPTYTVGDDEAPCSGFFNAEDVDQPVLVVATGVAEDRWLGTLLHEYSHLTQWAEKAPVWTADTHRDRVWDWLAGKSVKNLLPAIRAAQECEADCERRTVRLIRELNAPVNLDKYIRAANAYVHFYNVLAEKRAWYAPDRRPYDVPEVLALCSPTLDDDYRKTPPKLRAAIESCLQS